LKESKKIKSVELFQKITYFYIEKMASFRNVKKLLTLYHFLNFGNYSN